MGEIDSVRLVSTREIRDILGLSTGLMSRLVKEGAVEKTRLCHSLASWYNPGQVVDALRARGYYITTSQLEQLSKSGVEVD